MYKNFRFGFIRRSLFYVIAGSFGVLVDFLLFSLYVFFFDNSYLWFTNSLSYFGGTTVSYFFNSRISFKSSTHTLSPFRFFTTATVGLLASIFLLYTLIGFGLSLVNSKLLSIIVVVLFQYTINTLFSVKRTNHDS